MAFENPSLSHNSLDATIIGVKIVKDGTEVIQFRGLQYARIERRFARPQIVTVGEAAKRTAQGGNSWLINGMSFGPQCPQVHADIRSLFCIPNEYPEERFEQDEYRCLNLTVTQPAKKFEKKLPVMMWIHGGSQMNSINGPASRCSDTPRLVADSVRLGKPIIVVAINYRLNMFAFGNGKGERNLALQDQQCAIEWIRKHIEDFGGDKTEITLAGESAGGVYSHALSVAGAPVKRLVLQSGSLPLAPPQPPVRSESMLKSFEEFLEQECGQSLQDAPAELLVDGLKKLQITSVWLERTPELEGWQSETGKAEALMIGDCEFESILWMEGIRRALPGDIVESFDKFQGEELDLLKSMYCIEETLPKACKRGALDFINDFLFAEPVVSIANRWRSSGKPVYQYAIDEPNPWQPSAGAHHGVDLLFLFGDYDFSKNSYIEKTASEMRKRWILFVNGEKPWDGLLCAFGPRGVCDELTADSVTNRRRWSHFRLISKLRPRLGAVAGQLLAGKR